MAKIKNRLQRFQGETALIAEGNGRHRSPRSFLWGFLLIWIPVVAEAQLEVLLRGVDPAAPQVGLCGRYRFEADEPDGQREVEFLACIESVPRAGEEGNVVLRLWSGDSLEVRIALAPQMFEGRRGSLIEFIQSVDQIENGSLRHLEADDWRELPALSAAPELPVLADSSLGTRKVVLGASEVVARGRYKVEGRSTVKELSGVEMTQSERRQVEIWLAPEAPILGVVQAVAVVTSERRFERPIPGVPVRGPRVSTYRLELLETTRP